MGCFISTNTGARASGSKKLVGSDEVSSKQKGFRHESRAPPPPVEEETVKEVLSETPKPKPPTPVPQPEPVFTAEMKRDLQEDKVEAFAEIQEKQNLGSNEEIMSEVSEICSVSISESLSTVTNVTDNKRENEEEEEQEVRQRQRLISINNSRSPAKPPPPPRNGFIRDQPMNRSPSRRSHQSPARRVGNGSVRLVQNQEVGRVNKGPGRRDQGESSGRRSRSPATTRASAAATSRTSSAMRANRSPGRVRSEQIENRNGTGINSSRKIEAQWAAGIINDNNNNINNDNDNCPTNESLENPLVSLECFIFL